MARTAAQKFSRPLSTRRTGGQSTDEQGASPASASTERKARRVVVSGTRKTVVKGRVVPTSGRIVQNCDGCREGRNRCDRLERCSECRMRGRVCTYSAAGPSNAQIGSRPFQQNQEEIARLKKQVDILARVLRLTEDELEALSLEAGGPLNPPPPSRNSPPPDPRPKDRFDAMFSPGDPLIDLCRAAAVDSDMPTEDSQCAAAGPPPANLNIRAAGPPPANLDIRNLYNLYDDMPITSRLPHRS
ncbi:RHTO0S03e06590g1_1 [Rhodotorula toruloides]|uniref:RHTO0S03e06590g1_1 n=1 Tax=Rhodotorula toruloides TaxID=5286 RepID=A0A061AS79_RHOTO|nr:RHTO0S03e06590g1_1 [Rhodotorula toruloides]